MAHCKESAGGNKRVTWASPHLHFHQTSFFCCHLHWQLCWWCWVLALHRGSEQPVCYQGRPLSSYWRDQDPPVAILRYRHYGKRKKN